jgi:HSP20 family molecular chaperone IbpA
MKCPRCSREVEKGWRYCPKCGYDIVKKNAFFRKFPRMDSLIDRIHRQMDDDMNKMLEDSHFEVFDLSPFLGGQSPKQGKSRGFTVRISRKGDEKPNVSVSTFGDVDKEEVRREVDDMYRQAAPEKRVEAAARHAEVLRPVKEPSVTEEPETRISKTPEGLVVEMELPGVKSEDQIETKNLESSIEVKAVVGDKAYFKIITKPAEYTLTGRSFRNGIFRLVFS